MTGPRVTDKDVIESALRALERNQPLTPAGQTAHASETKRLRAALADWYTELQATVARDREGGGREDPMDGHRAIKNSERNHPVKKSLRLVKAARATRDRKEQETDAQTQPRPQDFT